MKSLPHAHYLFRKTPLPAHIDDDTVAILQKLEKVTDKEQYLRQAYDLITHRFEGGRVKTLSRIWELFSSNIEDLFSRPGFMHCTNQNYLLANVLVKSDRFKESDIKPRWTLLWFWSPHQYLDVKINDTKITHVDCWARHYGIHYGQFATGFNLTNTKSFAE